MYLKRMSKLSNLSVSRGTADVHLRDLTCPVCRGILIEPVTLPCTHNLCLCCLKGTFEHNSLSCPLCRIRVGSWLRTATKSDTLVNHDLWELIRAKFPKEVENKYNGEEGNLDLDADYTTNRILSAAGEIRREFEAQLQMAEKEMCRQRQTEQMASEALIKKIQAEEQQLLLTQLAQDQLLAKTLAKQQIVEKQKETIKCYNECLSASVPSYVFNASRLNTKSTFVNNVKSLQTKTINLEDRQMNLFESVRTSSKLEQKDIKMLSKIEERLYSNVYSSNNTDPSSMSNSRIKYCCQKQMPIYNAVIKTLRHQTISKFIQPCTSNYMDPGCSMTEAYITETKEELRIPSDVVNSKKKNLGIEVCMTLADNDERIGSAESSGSHDSINQEIHHFKPIKAVPRTKLKISTDGKLIDPKLIRVIPIFKKMSNAVPKPPSPTYMKRIIGCSWSAFRGRIKQDAKKKQPVHNIVDTRTLINQKSLVSPLTSDSLTVSNKLMKYEINDTIRRLDFVPEPLFDNNKNYTKNTNKIVNSTKISKKLPLNHESDTRKIRKSWRKRVKNSITKFKRYKNLRNIKKGTDLILNAADKDEDNQTNCNSSFDEATSQNDDNNIVINNTTEQITKKRESLEKKMLTPEMESDISKKSRTTIRNKASSGIRHKNPTLDQISFLSSQESSKFNGTSTLKKTKRRKINRISYNNIKDLEKNELLKNINNNTVVSGLRKSARNLTKTSSKIDNYELNDACNKSNSMFHYDSLPESCDETKEYVQMSNQAIGKLSSDKQIIEEQQRIEQLLLQEREDFELACRLQAQFDEMERISGRTRRSRKAIESMEIGSRKIDDAMKTICNTSGASKIVQRKSVVNQVVSTAVKKKLRRPSKCMKVTLNACENKTRARYSRSTRP